MVGSVASDTAMGGTDAEWTERSVKQMGLEVTTRPRGRPKLVQGVGPATFITSSPEATVEVLASVVFPEGL